MTIKQNGGVFGRNPTFNDVTIEGDLIINGEVFTGLDFQGSWNASTNSPALASSVGTKGEFYIVSVAGTTDLNGITNWGIGDWALFNGTVWQRVEGGADGNFDDLTANSLVVNGVAEFNTSATGGLKIENRLASSGTSITSYQGTTNANVRQLDLNGYKVSISTGAVTGTAVTERVMIDNIGNATISTGNLVIGTSGNGIDFSATAGTGTSELLDDYEEGTWTPSVGGDATYTTQTGRYTKVGRVVYFLCDITINVRGTGSASAISGLPFTAVGNNPCFAGYFSSLAASVVSISPFLGVTSINLYGLTAAATTASGLNLLGDGARIMLSGFYEV